jgi:non-ribosomal peptide synthetase component E (peptide arylation enzyme)
MLEAETAWQLVERRAEATPDALFALDEAGHELSFDGLRREAERAAAGLHALGIGEGSPVSWILPTRNAAFVLMTALARLGAVQNPLVPIYRKREVEFCVRQTGARWLLVPGTFRGFDFGELARELAQEFADLSALEVGTELPSGDPATLPAPPTSGGADGPTRWIFYTSGTTSDPKGAKHTDHAILVSSRGLVDAVGLGPDSRTSAVFPITHLGGANALISTLLAGSTQLVVEAFDPPTTIPFLARHGVTHAGAGRVFYQAYLEAQRAAGPEPIFPELRALYGGGAPTPRQLHLDVPREMGGLGILSTWGMTECPIISMTRWDDPPEKRVGTEGRPTHPQTRIRITRPDGSEAGTGEEGEILIHAPQLLRGFVDPRLDAEAFTADGFFRTGDLGSVDAEGYIVISGRMKDVIIRKGENISAPELEELLIDHPKVAEVAVIGLPDEERGERCCAVVQDATPDDPLGFDEMVEFLEARQLMRQKLPEQLEHLAELPRNASGKVVKAQLKQRFS